VRESAQRKITNSIETAVSGSALQSIGIIYGMETNKKINCEIVEFNEGHRDQVIKVIDTVLKNLEVIPASDELIDDEDLYKIPEVYKGRGRFWVALEQGRVIGTVAIREIDSNVAKLNRMFVLMEYHGTGAGQTLLNKALDFARQQGYKEVILNTHLLMKRAHHFYEKNGFVKIREDDEEYHYKLILD
jgi:N-acetylglutamate synthase-like GNAT family acetyltransferase